MSMLLKKSPPVYGEDGLLDVGLYCSTVDFATSIPSIFNSETIRGEPQVGLACHIRLMSFRNSGAIFGRPGRPC